MTIKFKESNPLDRLLLFFGKKRAYKIPVMESPYSYNVLQPENFFRALFRPAFKPPPSGWVYMDTITCKPINDKGGEHEKEK